MQGLDTNVLVRFLLRDDPRQAKAAKAAIDDALASGTPLFLSLLVVLETEWVLRTCANLRKPAIIGVFKQLLESRDLNFEDEAALEEALYQYEDSGAEFADCLLISRYLRLGCRSMLTFDAKAARLPGTELLDLR